MSKTTGRIRKKAAGRQMRTARIRPHIPFCAPLSLEQIFCTDDGYSCGRHAQKDPEGCVSDETCSAHGDNLVVHYDEKYAGAEDQKKGRSQENCIPKFDM